jgi:hypothetical protein
MNRNIEKASPQEVNMTKETSISRRDVLRGALVAGCSLFVPMAIFSSSANGAEPAVASGTKKKLKAGVKYQYSPNGAQKCSLCTNYVAASKTCLIVDGPIDPDGWCTLWAAKA